MPLSRIQFGQENNRNLIVNGAMQVSQRTTSEASVNSDRWSACDRFRIYNNQAHFTVSQETLTAAADYPVSQGFTKALKLDCTTAQASPGSGDRMQIRTMMEGQFLQHLKFGGSSAESLTLQFWVKATKTGTNTISMYMDDGNKHISVAYTISASNTWEKKIITFVGNTANAIANDNTRGLLVDWNLGGGTNYTSGTLRSTWTAYADADSMVGQVNHADNTNNNFHITGIQLEVGSVASEFEFRDYDDVFRHCQRYCYRIGGSGSELYNHVTLGIRNNTSYFWGPLHLPVPMRAMPNATISGNSSNCFGIWYGAGGSWDTSHTGLGFYGTKALHSDGSKSTIPLALNGIDQTYAAGYAMILGFQAAGFLQLDAEM